MDMNLEITRSVMILGKFACWNCKRKFENLVQLCEHLNYILCEFNSINIYRIHLSTLPDLVLFKIMEYLDYLTLTKLLKTFPKMVCVYKVVRLLTFKRIQFERHEIRIMGTQWRYFRNMEFHGRVMEEERIRPIVDITDENYLEWILDY